MAEGSNRENYVSLPNKNNGFGVNIGLEIKGDIENNPSTDMSASTMEIGPFVSADVERPIDNSSVTTANNINEGLWPKEAERDDLLFHDSDSDQEFVWDSSRGGTMPKLNLLEDMHDGNANNSLPHENDGVKKSSRESDRLLSSSSDGLYSEYNAQEQGSGNGTVVQMDNDDGSEDSMWHCHLDSPAKVDRVARNQLVAISVICVIFMIGEIIGELCFNVIWIFLFLSILLFNIASKRFTSQVN